MKISKRLAFLLIFFLFACQPNTSDTITIIDGEKIYKVESDARVPLFLLTQNGVTPRSNDRILLNGVPVLIDQPLPVTDFIQLQLRRAVSLTINSPDGQQEIQTSALTVGQAMDEAGYTFTKNDLLDPPAETPITQSLSVTFNPAHELTIYAGENILNIRSAAGTVGEALAEAGVPLIGFDTSLPLESEALPMDGQIRMVRIHESILVALESIPFESERIESADVPLGQEETIQPGVNGLAMIRTRIRYEDGNEVSRETEDEVMVREPQTRIVAGGSQIVLAPLPIDGVPTDYWLAMQMYATSYSPCGSGISGCSYGTASGLPLQHGVVAMKYDWYLALQGMRVFIPGYGTAMVADNNGSSNCVFSDCRPWIDLGYSDSDYQEWSGWVTVYFLAPAPAEIPYFLK